ncbi:hypothetical protein [Geomicrobium sp. JCM 19038]|uniref:hypothetical protein n=1 Tax=Geomicrobium sp. JCM 19038 TaxID=1460635 RepID=UPI00045F46CC|nr:hypothetical protein [Geomicrobium sp. JCM 19038]GAK08994.1 hypothetical protein JCM19038_2803 [Geomicrobium sp. JCM 19038]
MAKYLSDFGGPLINRNVFMFKHGEHQHLSQMQKGVLYMNNFGYFIEREKQENKKEIGDKLEATLYIEDVDISVIDEFDKESDPVNVDHITLISNWDKKVPLFCLFTIKSEELLVVEENKIDAYNTRLKLRVELHSTRKQKILSNFKGDVLFIVSPEKFLRQVNKYTEEKNISIAHGDVMYDNFSKVNSDRLMHHFTGNNKRFFWKDNALKHQQEYRIVFPNEYSEGAVEHVIGDMSQYTTYFNLEKLLSGDVPIEFTLRFKGENHEAS